MTERPGERQADLDWLYGREPAAAPGPGHVPAPPGDRPRIATPAYDSAALPQRPARTPQPPQPHHRQTGPSQPHPPKTQAQQHQPQAQTARRPRPLRLLRLLLILVLAWLVYLVATPVYALSRMHTVDQWESAARQRRQPGTAVLLVGSDARDPGPGYQPVPGDEELTAVRADTIMLLYQPRRGRPVLVSLPRDSYVPIPGFGQGKLNAAYAYGGPALLNQTVELVTGVQLDGYLEIGFDGFANLVDAVGGIEVCPEMALQDPYSGLDIPAGCSKLEGHQALAYVRMRYADPRGDIGRIERQREVIGKVVAKAARPSSVLNPLRYWRLNMAASKMLTRGDQTGFGDLLGAARGLIGVAAGEGLSLVVPIADPAGWSEEGESVVIWDRENALALFDEISRGDTSRLDRFAG